MTRDKDANKQSEHNTKTDRAVALGYTKVSTSAPVVLATGSGPIAKTIVDIAQAHGVYIKEDEILAESLSRLNLGQVIPPELYKAIGQVLAFVYALDSSKTTKAPEQTDSSRP